MAEKVLSYRECHSHRTTLPFGELLCCVRNKDGVVDYCGGPVSRDVLCLLIAVVEGLCMVSFVLFLY